MFLISSIRLVFLFPEILQYQLLPRIFRWRFFFEKDRFDRSRRVRQIHGFKNFSGIRLESCRCGRNPESGIHPLLRERWGGRVIAADGTTEKKAVAEIVFADEAERKWLEQIVHPFISREAEKLVASFPEDSRVMFDVPLLFECGWEKLVDETIAVWTPPEIQMERLLARGWSREHAEFRIQSQIPAAKKLELADYGIINHSDMENLKRQCAELNRILK